MTNDLDRYLTRIGIPGRPHPGLATLRALHRAHLRAIPYENLDVQLRRPVTTAREDCIDKIVRRGRGGWCYEMNGVLGWALEELGFKVTRLAGAVMRESFGDPFIGNHLVLKVELDEGAYLADAGFGDGPLEPFPIAAGAFSAGGFDFRLERADGAWWRLHNHPYGGAKSFDFRLEPADEALLATQCLNLQTQEWSPFVQNLVAQCHTPDGLVILRGRVVRMVTPHGFTDRTLDSAGELVCFLREAFGLDVPEAASLWPAIRERHDALFAAPAS
jgi:N-hydroxyarylamine O-acetyltransferase